MRKTLFLALIACVLSFSTVVFADQNEFHVKINGKKTQAMAYFSDNDGYISIEQLKTILDFKYSVDSKDGITIYAKTRIVTLKVDGTKFFENGIELDSDDVYLKRIGDEFCVSESLFVELFELSPSINMEENFVDFTGVVDEENFKRAEETAYAVTKKSDLKEFKLYFNGKNNKNIAVFVDGKYFLPEAIFTELEREKTEFIDINGKKYIDTKLANSTFGVISTPFDKKGIIAVKTAEYAKNHKVKLPYSALNSFH